MPATKRKNWIAVASAEHARLGRDFRPVGYMQVGQFDMGDGFVPWRRDVAYVHAQEAPILPLLEELEFVEDRSRWGYKFRFGLFEVGDADMHRIAHAMAADTAMLYFS
jgi:hypothetical protein